MAIDKENQAIKPKNIAINKENQAIENIIAEMKLNIQTKKHINKLYNTVGFEKIFGRSDESEICNISYSTAGNLIAKMKKIKLLDDVKGCGKGKYRFKTKIIQNELK